NLNRSTRRTVIVQGGGYGEHQLTTVTLDGKTTSIDSPFLTVQLEPGAGQTLELTMKRYANAPTSLHPWHRKRQLVQPPVPAAGASPRPAGVSPRPAAASPRPAAAPRPRSRPPPRPSGMLIFGPSSVAHTVIASGVATVAVSFSAMPFGAPVNVWPFSVNFSFGGVFLFAASSNGSTT